MTDWDRDKALGERNAESARWPTQGSDLNRDINDQQGPLAAERLGARAQDADRGSRQSTEPFKGQPAGYGDGGATPYGQMAAGSSDSGLGGYSGADVGGYGQPNLNSQWGQGGYAPLNQGIDYGQGGSRFGPAGYGGGYGGQGQSSNVPKSASSSHDDHHLPSYHHWRETQLQSHDRNYAQWRDEQTRRYDEDYGAWRNERHSAFSKEFEGWRAGRGGQAVPTAARPDAGANSGMVSQGRDAGQEQGFAHGANPTLARIADGDSARHHHKDKHQEDQEET